MIKKRAHERMPLEMNVHFFHFKSMYPGTIKNVSQNGMYIESNENLPFHSKLDLHIPFKSRLKIIINFKNEMIEIPVQIKRIVKNGSATTGMGVKLVNVPMNYMLFMRNLIPA